MQSAALLVDNKALRRCENNFPSTDEPAGYYEAVAGLDGHSLAVGALNDACAFEHVAILFLRVLDPPFAWLTTPVAHDELLARILVLGPDCLPWIS